MPSRTHTKNGSDSCSFYPLSACSSGKVIGASSHNHLSNVYDSLNAFNPFSASVISPRSAILSLENERTVSSKFHVLSSYEIAAESEMPCHDRTSFLSDTWDSHLKSQTFSSAVTKCATCQPSFSTGILPKHGEFFTSGSEVKKAKQKPLGKKHLICKTAMKPQRREPMGSENADAVVSTLNISSDTLPNSSTSTTTTTTTLSSSCQNMEPVRSGAEIMQKELSSGFCIRPPLVGQSEDINVKIAHQSDNLSLRGPYSNEINLSDSLFSSSTSVESKDSLSHRVEALLGEKVKLPKKKISMKLINMEKLSVGNSRKKGTLSTTDLVVQEKVEQVVHDPFISMQEIQTEVGNDGYNSDKEAAISISEGPISVVSTATVIPVKETKSVSEKSSEQRFSSLPIDISCEKNSISAKFENLLRNEGTDESSPSSQLTPVLSCTDQQFSFSYGFSLANEKEQKSFLKPEIKYAHKCLPSSDSNEADLDESGRSGYPSDNRTSPVSVSSFSSNKRLEWDSGADIGYGAVVNALSNLKGISAADLALLFRSEPEGISVFSKDSASGVVGAKNQMGCYPLEQDVETNCSLKEKMGSSIQLTSGESNSSINLCFIQAQKELCEGGQKKSDAINNISEKESVVEKINNIFESEDLLGVRKLAHVGVQTDPLHFTRDVEVQSKMPFRNIESPCSSNGSISSGSTVRIATEMVYERKIKNQMQKYISKLPVSEPGDLDNLSCRLAETKYVPFSSPNLLTQSFLPIERKMSSSLPLMIWHPSQEALLYHKEIPNIQGMDYEYKRTQSVENDKISDLNNPLHIRLPFQNFSAKQSDISLPCCNKTDLVNTTLRSTSSEDSDISCHKHLINSYKEMKELPTPSDSRNGEFSDSDSAETTNIDQARFHIFNDIAQLHLKFPYSKQLNDNMSSLLLLNENLGHQECEIFNTNTDNIVVIGSPGVERLISEEQPEGPKIRWYPMTGSPGSQDIRHAATQTSVSYIAENLTDGDSEDDYIDVECNEMFLIEKKNEPVSYSYGNNLTSQRVDCSPNFECQTDFDFASSSSIIEKDLFSIQSEGSRNKNANYGYNYCTLLENQFPFSCDHQELAETVDDYQPYNKVMSEMQEKLDERQLEGNLLEIPKSSNIMYELENAAKSNDETRFKKSLSQNSELLKFGKRTEEPSMNTLPSILPYVNQSIPEVTSHDVFHSHLSQKKFSQGITNAHMSADSTSDTCILPPLNASYIGNADSLNTAKSISIQNKKNVAQLPSYGDTSCLSITLGEYKMLSRLGHSFPIVEKCIHPNPRYAPAGQDKSQLSINPSISVTNNTSSASRNEIDESGKFCLADSKLNFQSVDQCKLDSVHQQSSENEFPAEDEIIASKKVSSEEFIFHENRYHHLMNKRHKSKIHGLSSDSSVQGNSSSDKHALLSLAVGLSDAEDNQNDSITGHQEKHLFIGSSLSTPRPKTLGQGCFSGKSSFLVNRLKEHSESSCRDRNGSFHVELLPVTDEKFYSSESKETCKEFCIGMQRDVPVGSVMGNMTESPQIQSRAPLHSLTQSETLESTHTGSDDAQSPLFSPEVLGSRCDPSFPCPGIYGNKKFAEKYLASSSQLAESTKAIFSETSKFNSLEKNQNALFNSGPSSIQKQDNHRYTENNNDENLSLSTEKNKPVEMKSGTVTLPRHLSDNCVATSCSSNTIHTAKDNLSAGGFIKSDHQITEMPSDVHNSSLQTTLLTMSGNPVSSDNTNEQTDDLRTEDCTSQTSTISSKSSIPLQYVRSISESKGKLSRAARCELEKLKNLVERQKQNYLKRLQMEVERLERLEDIVLYQTLKLQTSVSSNTSITSSSSIEQTEPKSLYYTCPLKRVDSGIQCTLKSNVTKDPFSSPLNTNSKHNAFINVHKKQSRKHKFRSSEQDGLKVSNSSDMNISRIHGILKKDFSQSFPSPLPSEDDMQSTIKMESVGVQTYNSLFSVDPANKDRYFISLLSPSSKLKNTKRGSSFNKDKFSNNSHFKFSKRSCKHLRSKIDSGVSWFIPTSSCKRYNRIVHKRGQESHRTYNMRGTSSEKNVPSLQEAFLLNCGHLIRKSQARLIRISKLAEIRRRCTALAIERAKLTGHTRNKLCEHKYDDPEIKKTFTHREMREQTEKVYKNLSEVVEKKDRKRREEQYKTNRLMAQVYNKKLQEQALKGKVSWAITQTCLSP